LTLTHEDRLTLALRQVAVLDERADALTAMGVPVAQTIRELSISILEEERREGDGCLARMEASGALSLRKGGLGTGQGPERVLRGPRPARSRGPRER